MENTKYYELEQQRVNKAGYKEIISGGFKYTYVFILLSIIGFNIWGFMNREEDLTQISSRVFLVTFTFSIFLHMLIMITIKSSRDKEKEEKNVALVNQEEEEEYFMKIGSVVKEHKGDIKETSKKENIEKDLLIKEKNYCTHWAVMGTTASGKTVYMQSIMKQILMHGGGFLFTDGKCTKKMIKDIQSLCWQYNRQKDFHLINFADPSSSNSMNLFELTFEQLQEVFNFILPKSDGGDEWRIKAVTLASSLLFFITALQKMKIAIDTDTISKINTYEDLKKYSKKSMNFNLFNKMLDSKRLIELCVMFERVYKNSPEFLDIFEKASKQNTKEMKVKAHDNLLSWLVQQINQPRENILTKEFKDLNKDDAFYSVGIAIGYFSDPISKFTNQYGEIFNRSDYDVNLEDIILNNRILYVGLPGTKSQDTVSMLAKIIIGNIVATYETLKDMKPLGTPFTVFLDEINSWGKDVEGLGNLLSQTREQKLVFVLGFQSDLMKLDSGKGLESEQLFANINNIVILKLKSPKLIKDLQEIMPKKRVLIDKQTAYVGGHETKEKMSGDKETFELKESPAFTTEEMESLAAGECYIKVAEKMYKAIGGYLELPNFYQDDANIKINLLQKRSK